MPDLQSRMRRDYLRRAALPTAAILLPIFGAIAWMCLVLPVHLARDTQGAARRREEARVIALTPVPGERFRDPYSQVTLRVGGGEGLYACYVPVHVGDEVWVDYRLGHSGRVYVSNITRVGP